MDVGYVEKTFETYINAELLSKYGKGWAPGQAEEGLVGFDFYFSISVIKHLLCFGKFFEYHKGIDINDIIGFAEKEADRSLRKLPKIKTNVLFQYKCPEYMTMPNSHEWNNWNSSYFRFKIDSNQQALIQKIHDSFSGILALYAAPAIKTADELYNVANNKKIIENTNFTEGYKLTNHKVNTYQEGGGYSIACSEPTKIESFQLDNLKDRIKNENNIENREYCIKFADQLRTLMKENKNTSVAYNAFFKNIVNQDNINLEKYPLINSYLTIYIFKEITGISSYIYV